MLFNSLEFLIFFPIVTIGYFLLPHRWRWLWLLLASCYFYMAFVPVYILILGFTIVVDYYAGILIERSHGPSRKLWLMASLVANVGVLAFFKYYNFLNTNLSAMLESIGIGQTPLPFLSILLPIGLSFHTFQAMSYTIEVYRGHEKAERHFGIYALYVMFYPQLVAGPIERPQNVLHQFHERHALSYENVTNGLKLMAWGLFKKVVVADRLALFVDHIYHDPHKHTGLPLLIGAAMYSFQIYCDFSGYSDMALGSAQTMGFHLMTNFRRPYHARSIPEFWSRWHISLSTWFRDYLYIPLGGNRVSVPRWYLNLMIVFLVSGLWHGAAWTFIVWGGLHAVYQVAGLITAPWRKRLTEAVGLTRLPRLNHVVDVALVFVLATVAWVFFRAPSLTDAWYVVTHMFVGIPGQLAQLRADPTLVKEWVFLGQNAPTFAMALASIAFMELVQYVQERYGSVRALITRQPAALRWGTYYALMLVILYLGVFESTSFIYFQF